MGKRKKGIAFAFYIMVIPMSLLFFIFHTYPFFQGVFYSFTNWKGYGKWSLVGLRNYIHIFSDPDISHAYEFTFFFAVLATCLVNIFSLLLALGLNAKIKFKNTLKAIFFLPYMLGNLIVGFVFNYIFANLLPPIGKALGIASLSVNILGTDNAWAGVLFVTVWQSLAFNTLIYLSGLQTIDRDLYEAADLDGAMKWKRFKNITFPLIAPFFTINIVLCVKNFLMTFDQVMAMTGGGPGTDTTTVSVLIYKKGFQGAQFAYQSADAVLFFLVIIAISLFQLFVLEKREERFE
ncbi:Lactose transport system permease protein LacF [Caprobacter fermentans]|uniref:Lactose transport system permease protein LacF n=1 Tax=Caproicibacter fermentans TaxID=2576756 RepID=A0A6N8HYS2_9FIRM|nr:sugar ABC transporter permease [Caproicibacter fermentans]MVB10849.1 Lactose transport system permease protein LacF [Caproicibacter fermentans]